MTTQEANNIYAQKVCRMEEKHFYVYYILGIILICLGILLLFICLCYFANKVENLLTPTCLGIIGAICLVVGVVLYLFKYKPNYSSLKKELYMNYVRCVDLPTEERDYYKLKVIDIHVVELTQAIYTSAAMVTNAVNLNTLEVHKLTR